METASELHAHIFHVKFFLLIDVKFFLPALYNNEKFYILARGCSSFNLSALEATFIKSLNLFLCKQKEFVYSLEIF